MKFIHTMKIFAGTLLCLSLFSQVTNSQTYSFKNYGAENNIPNSSVYTIDQSDDGFLWVGTGSGLARFDGYNFYNIQFPDSSLLRYTTSSLKDKNGTLWFGCNDGSIYYSNKNALVQVKLSIEKSISDLAEGPDGLIYVVPQGTAIFSINPARVDDIHKYTFSEDQVMLSAAFAGKSKMLIGTQESLLICNLDKDSVSVAGAVEGFDYSPVTVILQTGDSSEFVIGTDGSGLFKLHLSDTGNTLSEFINHPELESIRIQSIIRDSEKNLWISTFGSGVIQLSFSDNFETINSTRLYNLNSGLVTDDIKIVFQDIEENIWIGTYYEGISMLTSYAFEYYMP